VRIETELSIACAHLEQRSSRSHFVVVALFVIGLVTNRASSQ
jgi:hypothetical protein